MTTPIFITGIGTGIGKTLAAAIVAEALQADYWKPVQAGYEDGTDSNLVKEWLSSTGIVVHPELYTLKMAASPHIAAREENIQISIGLIKKRLQEIMHGRHNQNGIVIEGAGGLLVPLNEQEFVADLIQQLQAKVILVSRNYLGSINHSLLTARVCRHYDLSVAGWLFNDQYLAYEDEITQWSGYPKIGTIPFTKQPGTTFIQEQARLLKNELKKIV